MRPLKVQQHGQMTRVRDGQFEVTVTRTETFDLTGLLQRYRNMKGELEAIRRDIQRQQEREAQLVEELANSDALLKAEGIDPSM